LANHFSRRKSIAKNTLIPNHHYATGSLVSHVQFFSKGFWGKRASNKEVKLHWKMPHVFRVILKIA